MIATAPGGPAQGDSYAVYLDALLAGDRQRCRKVFESWLSPSTDLRVIYEDLVQRSLYDVGAMWEQGRVSVATEHLATAITESLLNLVYPHLFSRPRVGKSAVVACTANEYHQLGGKIVADIFELHGWRGYFLGANTPQSALLDMIRDKRPDVVALSLTVHFNLGLLVQTAAAIRTEFSDLPILVGGQGFRWGGLERAEDVPGVRGLSSLSDLESWISSGSAHGP